MTRAWREMTHHFWESDSGMTLPMLAMAFMAITGFVGSAIDIGRVQLVQSKLSFALDAAGLAAGSTLSTANATTEVNKYLAANFPAGYLGAAAPTATVTLSNNNMVINLAASVTLPTTFMQLMGISTMTVTASSQITKTASGLELVMVLDNTGSMSQSGKISALKTAATAMVNILYGGQASVPNLWIGLVPFSQAVNIGTGYASWLDTTYDSTLDWGPTSWGGCVDARETSGMDITDDPPSAQAFRQYYYPSTDLGTDPSTPSSDSSNPWKVTTKKTKHGVTTTTITYPGPFTTTSGPNAYCPQQVTPMTANQTTILNAINAMQPNGDTLIDLGLAWGWRMLSPRWRGLWGGEMNTNSLPLNYGTPHMNKAVILLTDGYNTIDNSDHGAYGYLQDGRTGSTNSSQAVTNLDSKMTSVCASLKANGVYVYTISLGTGTTTQIKTLLQNCASSANYYFDSPSSTQLQGIFSAIGDSLSNLRVSQ